MHYDDSDFPLNALGRNKNTDDWMPLHVDTGGRHRDPNGILIQPFASVIPMTATGMSAWLEIEKTHGLRMVSL